jgi:hypothetical protein
VIAALHRGEKRLVFADSRRVVEILARWLRARRVDTYVSHSSLAPDERVNSWRGGWSPTARTATSGPTCCACSTSWATYAGSEEPLRLQPPSDRVPEGNVRSWFGIWRSMRSLGCVEAR